MPLQLAGWLARSQKGPGLVRGRDRIGLAARSLAATHVSGMFAERHSVRGGGGIAER